MKNRPLLTLLLSFVIGCGTSQKFVAVPATIDRDNVQRQTIEMTAERFHYTPEELHVKAGTLVLLKITSIDGTHGFRLGAFGIDERVEKGETKTIELYASAKGEYGFHCSHLCGLGHLWMTGKLIIE